MLKRTGLTLVMTALLAGCAMPLLPGTPPGSSANQAVEPLAGLAFKPVSSANSHYLAIAGSGASAATPSTSTGIAMPASAPNAQASASPLASGGGGATSGDIYGGNYYNYPMGAPGTGGGQTPMVLVSATQAETAGAQATFQAAIKIAAPVVAAWGSDGRLIQSDATLQSDGTPATTQSGGGLMMPTVGPLGPYPQPLPADAAPSASPIKVMDASLSPSLNGGWHLAYYSASRSETLNFYVGADKTVIIRLKWAPLDLSPASVTVDSNAAIRDLTNAIQTQGFQSAEEKSGLDYFLGTPFTNAQVPGPYGPYGPSGQMEAVYQVPANAQWNASLQSILGKLVWQLNFYGAYSSSGGIAVSGPVSVGVGVAVPAIAPQPPQSSGAPMPVPSGPIPSPTPWATPNPQPSVPNSYLNNSGSGLIDAETGTVIRFSRPTRYYFSYNDPKSGNYSPPPSPAPKPSP